MWVAMGVLGSWYTGKRLDSKVEEDWRHSVYGYLNALVHVHGWSLKRCVASSNKVSIGVGVRTLSNAKIVLRSCVGEVPWDLACRRFRRWVVHLVPYIQHEKVE